MNKIVTMMTQLKEIKAILWIYTALTLLLFIGCQSQDPEPPRGQDFTQSFLMEYAGYFQETDHGCSDSGERIRIEKDGTMNVLRVRQVGQASNPDVPPQTTCSYYLSGQIRSVLKLSDETRTRKNPETGETFLHPATHEILFAVYDIRLTDELEASTTSNPHCHNFVELEKKRSGLLTLPMELFAQSLRFHTTGGGDYTGGERTESTLDEVFTRVETQ